jgi:hypothetical protein
MTYFSDILLIGPFYVFLVFTSSHHGDEVDALGIAVEHGTDRHHVAQ